MEAKETTAELREFKRWKMKAGDVFMVGDTEVEVIKVSGGRAVFEVRPKAPEIKMIGKPAIDGSAVSGSI